MFFYTYSDSDRFILKENKMIKNKPLLTIAAVEEELRRTYFLDKRQFLERRLETLKLLQELGLYEEEKPVEHKITITMIGHELYQVYIKVPIGEEYIGTYESYVEALNAGNEAYNKKELAEKKNREEGGIAVCLTAKAVHLQRVRDKHIKEVVNKLYELIKRGSWDNTAFTEITTELKKLDLIDEKE